MEASEKEEYEIGEYYPRKGLLICCPNCDEKSFGRRNQKFCDARCRNEYHNGKRSERNSHVELVKLKEADKNLKLLHDKFGDTAVPERVLDAFGLCGDFLQISMEFEQFDLRCFMNYALRYT